VVGEVFSTWLVVLERALSGTRSWESALSLRGDFSAPGPQRPACPREEGGPDQFAVLQRLICWAICILKWSATATVGRVGGGHSPRRGLSGRDFLLGLLYQKAGQTARPGCLRGVEANQAFRRLGRR